MRGALLLGLAAGATACSPEATPPPQEPVAPAVPVAPPGTAFLVDELPVSVASVDRVATWIELLRPEISRNQARRLALAEVVLPRAAVAARHAEARGVALAACEEARAAPDLGQPAWRERLGAYLFAVEGPWTELGGPDLWGFARELDEGLWSGPFERVGQLCLVRRVATLPGAAEPRLEELRLEVAAFPYLSLEAPVAETQRSLDAARLTLVDPAWREIVPEEFQYRMRGGEPR